MSSGIEGVSDDIPFEEITDNFEEKVLPLRKLQNSLRGGNSMIAKPVRFFANRHNLMALGDLRKIESGEGCADLRPNGILEFPPLSGCEKIAKAEWILPLIGAGSSGINAWIKRNRATPAADQIYCAREGFLNFEASETKQSGWKKIAKAEWVLTLIATGSSGINAWIKRKRATPAANQTDPIPIVSDASSEIEVAKPAPFLIPKQDSGSPRDPLGGPRHGEWGRGEARLQRSPEEWMKEAAKPVDPATSSPEAVPPRRNRLMELPLTETDQDLIAFVVEKLASMQYLFPWTAIKLMRIKKKINYLHPFRFLWTIFSNPRLSELMRNKVNGDSMAKAGFMGGVNEGMGRESRGEKIESMIPIIADFAESVGTTEAAIKPLILAGVPEGKWDALVDHLISISGAHEGRMSRV